MKHTPGPWTAEFNERYEIEDSPWGIRCKNGYWLFNVLDSGSQPHGSKSEANARLIASAPDLLEALKEAENALADYIPTLERRGGMMNYGRKVLAQVSAAIAKAEGQ